MSRFDNEDEDAPKFFNKDNAVNVKLYYDENNGGFIAIATLAATGEIITEARDEEDPGEALDDIAGTLILLTEKPGMFNDKLRVIGENARKPAKKASKVVSLR